MERHVIRKVLIANRGEIALRVQRACRALGIKTVSIASAADREALFARQAEELIVIGAAPPRDSYLNMEKIIAAAKSSGADAVHPGYGFLSENADFARKVIEAGLNYIGPRPESIAIMGSKTAARERVAQHGVHCTPGTAAGLSDAELAAKAESIGYPVLIKAVAGGGGRGMRVANSSRELTEVLPRARAEALKNFSSEDVYIEKYILLPRHVEVQIFGDAYGNVVHFGTRDCSTQRRHQKLIEEAPAPNLPAALRESIHNAAVQAAKSVNYRGAGTCEFLVSGSDFYFLEMNTRIQVEHPVTEAVTGIDLVQLQLKVAMGEPLPMTQDQIKFSGHAIEFRIYAEDPCRNFAPANGCITVLKRAALPWVREDYAFEQGDQVNIYYDAMISKMIILGDDRLDSIEKSIEALNVYQLEGVTTSIAYHLWLLYNGSFRKSPVDIGFVERELTPEAVRAIKACRLHDPRHQKPTGGAEVKSTYNYTSKKFGKTCEIEILHTRNGTFVARPVDMDGTRARNMYCRRSNGLNDAVKCLINDVLEQVPPPQLFGAQLHV